MAQKGNINVNGLSIPVWDMQSTAQQIDDATQRVAATPGSGAITYEDVGALPAIEDSDNPGCYYRMVGEVQEWINPPMVLGVEYRTIYRHNGNPVYKIAWPAGDFPNNTTKTVEVNTGTPGAVKSINSYAVLDEAGTQIQGLYGGGQFLTSNFLGMFLQNDSNGGKFGVALGSSRTVNNTATIFIDYTRG